jgi:predicted DNA-binding transcriptional regulator YafY
MYLKRRDLLPSQEIIHEDERGITLTCQASHENQIIPLIFYWLPNIDVLEPAWLKSKVLNTLQNYITTVRTPRMSRSRGNSFTVTTRIVKCNT